MADETRAQPGWYPVSPSTQRYWDGNEWTEYEAPLEQAPAPMQLVSGTNGQAGFDGQFVVIARRGLRARATVGKGEKRIPISSITAVQWKPAGAVVNGFIQFSMSGGSERRSQFGSQTKAAVHDENSVVFTKAQMPAFQALRSAVEGAISPSGSTPVETARLVAQPTVLDQLEHLGRLHDSGVLTDAEFAEKKEDLLRRL